MIIDMRRPLASSSVSASASAPQAIRIDAGCECGVMHERLVALRGRLAEPAAQGFFDDVTDRALLASRDLFELAVDFFVDGHHRLHS